MKITVSKHASERVIQRVKDVKTNKEASEYLIDKFTRMRNWEKKIYWGKSKIIKQEENKFILKNKTHTFVYAILPSGIYNIITYFTKQSYRNYKKGIKQWIKNKNYNTIWNTKLKQ